MKPVRPSDPAEPHDDGHPSCDPAEPAAGPGQDVFTDDDLRPSPEQRRALWRAGMDRAATMVAVTAAGIWAGLVVSAQFCLSPAVDASLPQNLGDAVRGAAALRADSWALGCAATLLGAEVLRTLLRLRQPLGALSRIRRLGGVLAAAAAAYVSLILTPKISLLLASGVVRSADAAGGDLGALVGRADTVRLGTLGLLALGIVLHIATLQPRAQTEPDDELEAVAPMPPGPRHRPIP